jgi:hypothetical protein
VIVATMVLAPHLAGQRSAEPLFPNKRVRRIWAGGALAVVALLALLRLLVPFEPKHSQAAHTCGHQALHRRPGRHVRRRVRV